MQIIQAFPTQFVYGLAFFSMGHAIVSQVSSDSDARLRRALWPLAAFGLIHGSHEWMEMFREMGALPWGATHVMAWEIGDIVALATSFLCLGAFGELLLPGPKRHPVFVLGVVLLWAGGVAVLAGRFPQSEDLWGVLPAWTRYVLAIPCSLLAAQGLLAQRRIFLDAGMFRFAHDSRFAALAFATYGVVGQAVPDPSLLPPSTVVNSETFRRLFGFPIPVVRAALAVVAAFYVIRFLRSFEFERKAKLEALRVQQLHLAQENETVRRELLRRTVAAEEAERRRVARELHDETGQALTAIGMGLRGVETAVTQNHARAIATLHQLQELVDHSIDELQRLISNLRPSHLDDLGLPAALRWYVGQVHKRTQIAVSVDISGDPRELASHVSTSLFRVTQEAIANVIKHAHASAAHVRLHYSAETVSLTIEDDGRGFDPHERQGDRRTWGLIGLEERVLLHGGELHLTSAPGHGTTIDVRFPDAPTERSSLE